MTQRHAIRAATSADREAMLALLPRLADFDVPAKRNPEDLWRGDEKLLRKWLAGESPDARARVAIDTGGALLGLSFYTLREEPLSGEPSAHLEVLVVAAGAQGRGIGTALLSDAQDDAIRCGARSMTLHVVAANTRALGLYERAGFDGEIVRCIKWFDER